MKRREQEEREAGGHGDNPDTDALLFDEGLGISDAYVRCYRRDEQTTSWVMHARLPVEDAHAEKLAELFGGGRYRVQLCTPDPERAGRIAVVRTRELMLPGEYRRPKEVYGLIAAGDWRSKGPGAEPAGTAAAGAPQVTTREALDAAVISQALDTMQRMQRPGPSVEWGPIITGALTLLTTLVTKMMDRPGADPAMMTQLAALQAEVAALRDTEKPGAAETAVSDVLASIERIVAVTSKVRKLAGEEPADPEAAMWGLGKVALQALLPGAQAAPAPAAAAPAPPQGVAGSPPPLWQRLLIQQGAAMVAAARRGVDPALAADYMVQMLPSEVTGVLTELVAKPDVATIVQQVVPEMAQHPIWLNDFIREVRAALQGEESEAEVVDEEDTKKD